MYVCCVYRWLKIFHSHRKFLDNRIILVSNIMMVEVRLLQHINLIFTYISSHSLKLITLELKELIIYSDGKALELKHFTL